jgi:hypothetical protein
MLQIIEEIGRRRGGMSRRTLLEAGSLGLLGLLGSQASASPKKSGVGTAKSIIWLHLSGGPSQYETFDPKPDAPAEIRGPFKPIATRVPSVRVCELLPKTAAIADRVAFVRSMSTNDPNHESGGYWVMTGYKYAGPNMRATHPTDWPSLAAVLKLLHPSTKVPFSSVMLPEPIIANPGIFMPGQNAGFLGRRWDPEILKCDPASPDFKIDGLVEPEDVSGVRLSSRMSLLQQLESRDVRRKIEQATQEQDRYRREAAQVLAGGARTAFELRREPPAVRDRYGRNKWGQSVLLARRLVEAGVRMVFVNWPRDPGDLASASPLWDTHANNNARMKDVLCPQFDLGFTALIDDLEQRGMLSETLVVAIGEMGRTPTFNGSGGRDHWGNVFSFAMAGGGIRGGQAYGSSDAKGTEPATNRVQPQDLTATILHLLGVGHGALFHDRLNRPFHATQGTPIAGLV